MMRFNANDHHLINFKRWLNAVTIFLLAFALGGCVPKAVSFKNTDITGSALTADFTLKDTEGRAKTMADFKGKVVVLFFGYTQCPDVCPTTLQTMATALQGLGEDAGKVQVVFVTIDPKRDTPELLKQYVPQFNPTFIGLTGSDEELAKAAKGMRVFYQKVDGKTASSYTFDHTAGAYVFDPKGQLRLLIKHGQPVEQIIPDLQALIKGA